MQILCKALGLVEKLPAWVRLPVEDALIFLFWRDKITRGSVPSIPPTQVEYDVALFTTPTNQERRRIRKVRNGGAFTARDWQRLLARDQRCLCCGAAEHLTADHVVPLAKGGRHAYSNMQVLCRSCNSRKHTTIIDYRKK